MLVTRISQQAFSFIPLIWCVHSPGLCRLEQAVCYADLSLVTRLDLSSNRLTELPPSLDKMVNLEYLDLSNNNLKVLPRSILTFDRLKEIRLNGNDFSSGDSADGPEQINGLRNYGDWLFRKDD
jgi:hypothetical protein